MVLVSMPIHFVLMDPPLTTMCVATLKLEETQPLRVRVPC